MRPAANVGGLLRVKARFTWEVGLDNRSANPDQRCIECGHVPSVPDKSVIAGAQRGNRGQSIHAPAKMTRRLSLDEPLPDPWTD